MKNRIWIAVTAGLSAASLGLSAAVLGVVLDRPTVTSVDRQQTALLREIAEGNEHMSGHLDALASQLLDGQAGKQAAGAPPSAEQPGAAEAAETPGGTAFSGKATAGADVASLPAPPPGKVTVKLAWTYKKMPGGEFELFWPAPELKEVGNSSYRAGVKVKTGAPIKDGILFLEPGEHVLVQAIWKNPSAKAKSFFVIPHIVTPSKYQSSTPLKCICTGTIYFTPPHGTFSRVMDITVTKDTPAGAKLIGTHDVVGSS